MVEEDDESGSESEAFSLEQTASDRESTRSAGSGVTTKVGAPDASTMSAR